MLRWCSGPAENQGVEQLVAMGFSRGQAARSLAESSGNVADAALILSSQDQNVSEAPHPKRLRLPSWLPSFRGLSGSSAAEQENASVSPAADTSVPSASSGGAEAPLAQAPIPAMEAQAMSLSTALQQVDLVVVIGEEAVLDMASVMLQFASSSWSSQDAGGQSDAASSSGKPAALRIEFRDLAHIGSSDWLVLGAAAVIFIFDTTQCKSFQSLKRLFACRRRASRSLGVLLVGDNSMEMSGGKRQVYFDDAADLADEYDMCFLEEPASQRRGAEEILSAVATEIGSRRARLSRPRPPLPLPTV